MTYNLTEIQTELAPNDNIKLTLFDLDKEVSVELLVPDYLLRKWYRDEFTFYYGRTVGTCPTDIWYQEYLRRDEKKAWDIWERANIENLTFNTVE